MFIKIRSKIIEVILVLTCTIIGLNFLMDFGVIDYYTNPVFQQILLFGIVYAALSRLLSYKKKYNLVLFLGQAYFFSVCALLYYSHNIADFVAAIICLCIDVEVIIGIKALKEKGKR